MLCVSGVDNGEDLRWGGLQSGGAASFECPDAGLRPGDLEIGETGNEMRFEPVDDG